MRNKDKYVYLTIGILKGSQTHRDLTADAEEHNTKQLPTVAAIRLGDYYRMRREGFLVGGTVERPPSPDKDIQIAHEALSNAVEADDAWPE